MLNYWFKSYLEENEDNKLKSLKEENEKLKREVEELKILKHNMHNKFLEVKKNEERNKKNFDIEIERIRRNFDNEIQTQNIYIQKINTQNNKFIENNKKIYKTLKEYVANTAKHNIVNEFLLEKEKFAELIQYFDPTSKTLFRIRTLRSKYMYKYNQKYKSLTTYNYKDEKINSLINKLFYNELTYSNHEEEVVRLLICFCDDYYVNISMNEDFYMSIDNYFNSLYLNNYKPFNTCYKNEYKQLKLFYAKYIEFIK